MALLAGLLAFEGILVELGGYKTGMLLTLSSAALAFLFYRGAITSAVSWGETVKVAFDL